MIEIYKCNKCGFKALDMAFYKPGSDIAICPKCNSDNIEIVSKKY